MPLHLWSLRTLPTLPKEETAPQISPAVPPPGSPSREFIVRRRKNSTRCRFYCSSTFGPLLQGSLVADPGRARGVGLPRRNNSMGRSGAPSYFRAERVVWQQDGHPHLRCAPAAGPRPPANQVPPGPGPSPLALPQTPVVLAEAAPVGPERHCRERRGPSAGGGLGNRGAIRAGLLCTDRKHGGTQAASRRSGSPREARSEGPKVLLFGRVRRGSRSRLCGGTRSPSRSTRSRPNPWVRKRLGRSCGNTGGSE